MIVAWSTMQNQFLNVRRIVRDERSEREFRSTRSSGVQEFKEYKEFKNEDRRTTAGVVGAMSAARSRAPTASRGVVDAHGLSPTVCP
jgi:hypothetical protein